MDSFKNFLEMTMSFDRDTFLGTQDFSGAEHIGDVGQSKILYKKINGLDFYGITESGNPDRVASYFQVQNQSILSKDYLELRNTHTEEDLRGQHYAKNLLFFLRNVEKKSIIFGDIQSRLGQEFVKSVGMSGRFPMFWLNINTGEKHNYDAEKDNYYIKPYRSISEPTGWVVMVEELKGKSFTSRFLTEGDINYWHKYIEWFSSNCGQETPTL